MSARRWSLIKLMFWTNRATRCSNGRILPQRLASAGKCRFMLQIEKLIMQGTSTKKLQITLEKHKLLQWIYISFEKSSLKAMSNYKRFYFIFNLVAIYTNPKATQDITIYRRGTLKLFH